MIYMNGNNSEATAGQDIKSIGSGRNDIGVKLKSNFRS